MLLTYHVGVWGTVNSELKRGFTNLLARPSLKEGTQKAGIPPVPGHLVTHETTLHPTQEKNESVFLVRTADNWDAVL